MERLLQEGYDTTIYDIEPITSKEEIILASVSSTLSKTGGHLSFHLGNIKSSKQLEKVFKNPPHGDFDGVIHLAGVTRAAWCAVRESDCREVNVEGTKNLLNAALPLDSKKFKSNGGGGGGKRTPWLIHASSLEVYGDVHTATGNWEGGKTFGPTTALGRTKVEAEKMVTDHQAELTELGIPSNILVLRPSLVYGGDYDFDDRLLPGLVLNALSDLPLQVIGGDDTFDFLHMSDAVQAFVRAVGLLQSKPPRSRSPMDEEPMELGYFEDFDIVSGSTASITEISTMITAFTKSASPVQYYTKGSAHAGAHGSITLSPEALETLGFQAEIMLERGIPMYVEHIRQSTITWAKDFLAEQCPESDFGLKMIMQEEDLRNRNIRRLNGCTVNIGVRHDEWLHHLKCGSTGGVTCLPDNIKVPSYNWNQTVFTIHQVKPIREETAAPQPKWNFGFGQNMQDQGSFLIEFAEEQTGMKLGFFREGDVQNGVDLRLMSEEDTLRPDAVTTFEPRVSHDPYKKCCSLN